MSKKIKVLAVRPKQKAVVEEIGNSLEEMQAFVGDGLIEVIRPFPDEEIVLVCNEEGKCNGLLPCRALYDKHNQICDIVCGDFFLAYAPYDSEEFLSMPEDLLEKYKDRFFYPELFFKTPKGIAVKTVK